MCFFLKLKWIYRLKDPEVFDIQNFLNREGFPGWVGGEFSDRNNNLRLTIDSNGRATVHPEYAWDGCSPKFVLWDLMIGTPDGMPVAPDLRPKTFRAALIHDALYQFLGTGIPFLRKDIDNIFLMEMERTQFAPRRIYWAAVRIFGGVYHGAIRKIRKHQGSMKSLAV